MRGLYDPRAMDDMYQILVPSLVKLAQRLKEAQYTVGYIYRSSNRFMDVHCYPSDDVCYEAYWSAAEQSVTEAEPSDDTSNDADNDTSNDADAEDEW